MRTNFPTGAGPSNSVTAMEQQAISNENKILSHSMRKASNLCIAGLGDPICNHLQSYLLSSKLNADFKSITHFFSGVKNKTLEEIAQEIANELGATNQSPKHYHMIIGTSLGGLLAKELLAEYNIFADKIITIATPHQGCSSLGAGLIKTYRFFRGGSDGAVDIIRNKEKLKKLDNKFHAVCRFKKTKVTMIGLRGDALVPTHSAINTGGPRHFNINRRFFTTNNNMLTTHQLGVLDSKVLNFVAREFGNG